MAITATKTRTRTSTNMRRRAGRALIWGVLLSFGITTAACGGAAGGAGAGRGLILLSFIQDGFDNVALNQILELRFSGELDQNSIDSSALQLREGPTFGKEVKGSFRVEGARVLWEPVLPGLCDLSDGGFKADTQYRMQTIGFPEEFAIRNIQGQPLDKTTTHEFHTRLDTDPARFIDAVPGTAPSVLSVTPTDASQAVDVMAGNSVELTLSENLDPCTVSDLTVQIHIYQFGDAAVFVDAPNGLDSGFALGASTADQTPTDPFTWGTPGAVTLPLPQKILSNIQLVQSFASTQILITPDSGQFPENSLVVVRLTSSIEDFGGTPLAPLTMSFTTENVPVQLGKYVMEAAGETPFDDGLSTADVNTARSPSLIQGFLLFAGDGDNGIDPLTPTLPQSDPGTCMNDYHLNDAIPDDFDPTGDVLLDTGMTANLCPNDTDGSLAVVWEFNTLHIRDGVTVRLIGINPAIFLIQGDALIENGARLLARGDGQGGSPRGQGEGNKTATTTAGCLGGVGVAGGGDGGASPSGSPSSARKGGDGVQGYFHTSPVSGVDASVGMVGGVTGGGHGQMSAHWTSQSNPNNRNGAGGGGGGHAEGGDDGEVQGTGSAPTNQDTPVDGVGGLTYGENTGKMVKPEAGSGGGAGGEIRPFSGTAGRGPGGGGGAGGGFLDMTCGGNLVVFGTIDAAGGVGGSNPGGNFNPNYSWQPGVGGGGGGSGGGIRLLTPNDIEFGSTTVITAAGGSGGAGGASQAGGPPVNDGGNGGPGRLAFEDGNSVITNLGSASLSPGEGSMGFYRGVFDANRFQGGGLAPQAVTKRFAVGPLNPMYANPIQNYGVTEDFIAGIPVGSSPGAGKTTILIEARGYQMLPDASADLTGIIAPPTGWFTVGHFTDSGVENLPTWNLGQPNATQLPGGVGNSGAGIGNLDTFEYIQLRISIFLNSNLGPIDPGGFLDRWTICFTSDN